MEFVTLYTAEYKEFSIKKIVKRKDTASTQNNNKVTCVGEENRNENVVSHRLNDTYPYLTYNPFQIQNPSVYDIYAARKNKLEGVKFVKPNN